MKNIFSAILLMACTTSLSQAQPDTLTGILTADVDLNTNTCQSCTKLNSSCKSGA